MTGWKNKGNVSAPSQPEKTERIWQRLKDKFNAALDRFFPPFTLGLQPAFAYGGISSASKKTEFFNKPQLSYFDTGEAPKEGSIEHTIMQWKNVEIILPGEVSADAKKDGRRFITIKEAQEAVGKMLKNNSASHQYLVYEATKLCGDEEITRYTLHIMIGALAEDYVFAPGETVDDIITSNKRGFRMRYEVEDALVSYSMPSLLTSLFRGFNRFYKKFTSTPEKNPAARPYDAHFYNPTKEEGLNILNGELKFQSALERIEKYWMIACEFYSKGEKPNAYCALGHILHLICDLHVPAHVHNDLHGPTVFLGKLDSFETWVKQANYSHLQRGRGKANITIWDSSPLVPPKRDSSWNSANALDKLKEFVKRIATNTQRFRSVDAEGTDEDQWLTGKLSDDECYYQGSKLIPSAIESSAQLIVNFRGCVKSDG